MVLFHGAEVNVFSFSIPNLEILGNAHSNYLHNTVQRAGKMVETLDKALDEAF